MNLKETYNKYMEQILGLPNTPAENYEKKFSRYMEYFSLTDEDLNDSILDVGSGSGDFIKYVRNKFNNTHAFAVDKSESRMKHGGEGMVIADGLSLPFPDNTFQTVTARNFIPMFVSEPEKSKKAIYELIRVCKSQGKVMADISLPEGEIEESNKAMYKGNINFANFFDARIKGGIELEMFFEDLKKEGYDLGIKKGKEFILTIHKP
ncbi:MAG: methyltransferase 11 protein [Patescibacteria group bacterium]|nr:methyltransferase 11 protein [Patescibacteria group bacterium]